MANHNSRPRVALPGSERQPIADARALGPLDPHERVEVSVYLRPPVSSDLSKEIEERVIQQRRPLSREEYAARHGASVADIALVEQFAREYVLSVVEVNAARRYVKLAGTARAINTAFGTQLHKYTYQGKSYRGRTGSLSIPAELAPIVTGVFGIDDRPQASPHIRLAPHATTSYTPPQLAQLYNFPTSANGSGQTVGIIELGGGYQTDDLKNYFGKLGLPVPSVVSVSVDGGKNSPGDPNGADGEVALDIEVIGGIAPGAKIAVYFAPNTDAGFLDAITTAIHDTTNKPAVISISWGQAESGWTSQALKNMDSAFQAAAALGVTVCAAAGDSGSSDGASDGLAHVDFPASDPYVLGCGGTSLQSSGSTISSEKVWNDNPTSSATGGGVSDNFALPAWQQKANVPPSANAGKHVGRGVPDVAGNADPQTGYQVLVDGQSMVIGGTSAVAPLWSGLIARLNQQLGKPLGYPHAALYQLDQASAFHDITDGNNGSYTAAKGWDACSGLGSPNGAGLLAALTSASGASTGSDGGSSGDSSGCGDGYGDDGDGIEIDVVEVDVIEVDGE